MRNVARRRRARASTIPPREDVSKKPTTVGTGRWRRSQMRLFPDRLHSQGPSSPTDRGGRRDARAAACARAPPPPARSQVKAFDDKATSRSCRSTRFGSRHPQIRRRGGETASRRAAGAASSTSASSRSNRSRARWPPRGEAGEAVAPGGVPLFYEESLLLEVEEARGGYFFHAADLTGTWAQAEFARPPTRGGRRRCASPRFRRCSRCCSGGGAPPGEAGAIRRRLRRAVRGGAHRWDAGERGAGRRRRRRRRRRKPRGGRRRGGRRRTRRVGARSRRGARASGADGAVGRRRAPVRLPEVRTGNQVRF